MEGGMSWQSFCLWFLIGFAGSSAFGFGAFVVWMCIVLAVYALATC
jgi:hypothetical protein